MANFLLRRNNKHMSYEAVRFMLRVLKEVYGAQLMSKGLDLDFGRLQAMLFPAADGANYLKAAFGGASFNVDNLPFLNRKGATAGIFTTDPTGSHYFLAFTWPNPAHAAVSQPDTPSRTRVFVVDSVPRSTLNKYEERLLVHAFAMRQPSKPWLLEQGCSGGLEFHFLPTAQQGNSTTCAFRAVYALALYI